MLRLKSATGPVMHDATEPSRKLLVAVIAMAVEDTCRPPTPAEDKHQQNRLRDPIKALRWIFSDSPVFELYCLMVDIEPDHLRRRLIKSSHEDGQGSTFRPDQRQVFQLRYGWAQRDGIFRKPYDTYTEDKEDADEADRPA